MIFLVENQKDLTQLRCQIRLPTEIHFTYFRSLNLIVRFLKDFVIPSLVVGAANAIKDLKAFTVSKHLNRDSCHFVMLVDVGLANDITLSQEAASDKVPAQLI